MKRIIIVTTCILFCHIVLAQDINDVVIGQLYRLEENREASIQNKGFCQAGDFDFEGFVNDFGVPNKYTTPAESRVPLIDDSKTHFKAEYIATGGLKDVLFFEDNALCGYNIYSQRFSVAKKFFDGGLKIGDPISKVTAIFNGADHFVCEGCGQIVSYTDKSLESTSTDRPNFWFYEGDFPIAMIIKNGIITYMGLYINEY